MVAVARATSGQATSLLTQPAAAHEPRGRAGANEAGQGSGQVRQGQGGGWARVRARAERSEKVSGKGAAGPGSPRPVTVIGGRAWPADLAGARLAGVERREHRGLEHVDVDRCRGAARGRRPSCRHRPAPTGPAGPCSTGGRCRAPRDRRRAARAVAGPRRAGLAGRARARGARRRRPRGDAGRALSRRRGCGSLSGHVPVRPGALLG